MNIVVVLQYTDTDGKVIEFNTLEEAKNYFNDSRLDVLYLNQKIKFEKDSANG